MELFTATRKLKGSFGDYRYSLRAQRVTWHTSIRYSNSCHTRVNMSASILFTAAMIRAFRSARSRGNGGTNKRSLTYFQGKKTQGVMSGDFGGHNISGCHFQKHALSNVPVKLCSGTDEPHIGSGWDLRLAGI
jgi:hypothetical protein